MDIIKHIKSKGMTVAAVARMAQVSRPTIYALANANVSPRAKTVAAVASILGVSAADIRPELGQ